MTGNESPENIQETTEMADNESSGRAQPGSSSKGVDYTGIIIGAVGIIVGIVQIALEFIPAPSFRSLANPRLWSLISRVVYLFALIGLTVLILRSRDERHQRLLVVAMLIVAVVVFFFIGSLEAKLNRDESTYNFEQDKQNWTVGTLDFGHRLGSEPFVSAERAFAGRKSLAFDIALHGANKAERGGIAQLRLADSPPLPGTIVIAHVFLPSDAPDNIAAQFALITEEQEIAHSITFRLYTEDWTSVQWTLPETPNVRNAELALQFYLTWSPIPIGRVSSTWEGRIFVDSIEIIYPEAIAFITPTPSLPPSATPTIPPTATATPTPAPVVSPTLTETVTPSPTPSPTPTPIPPSPTATPTPAPALEPAPVPAEPPDGDEFDDEPFIDLRWTWPTRELRPHEHFAVRVWPATQPGVGESIAWVRETFYRLDISHFEPGEYKWNIAVVHATQEYPYWEPLSYNSSAWTFKVVSAPPPTSPPRPTPTPR